MEDMSAALAHSAGVSVIRAAGPEVVWQEGRFVFGVYRREMSAIDGTPLRLSAKLLQRDIEGSNAFLLDADRRHQLNTRDFPASGG